MKSIIIEGGSPLQGEIKISGSKNASLPILAATLLIDEEIYLKRVPQLQDIFTLIDVLEILGKKISFDNKKNLIVSPGTISSAATPYELVKKMRASILVAGPLLARVGKVKIALPGGCAIGVRPIDLHIKGFEKLGAQSKIQEGYLYLKWRVPGHGTSIYLDFPSVGATENLIMASCLLEGQETEIANASLEPEVCDLIDFLNQMGAQILRDSKGKIYIKGVKKLRGGEYKISPDRIETGTYLLAGAITQGEITVGDVLPYFLEAVLNKLKEAGLEIKIYENEIKIKGVNHIKATSIETAPYPGFPTDLQAQWTALMSIAEGVSIITENIFENRFLHIGELQRMGACIRVKENTAIVNGVRRLSGASITAPDLRGAASLILAGLSAQGTTTVYNIEHLERGYENMVEKLAAVGAKIKLNE